MTDAAPAAWIAPPGWKVLRFSGPDRKKFLQGLLTSDVLSLRPGRGQPSCLLNSKGKIRAYFLLYDLGDNLVAVGSAPAMENAAADLGRYLPLSQTRLEDCAASRSLLFLVGAKAPEIISRAFAAAAPEAPGAIAEFDWKNSPLAVYSDPRPGLPAYGLILDSARKADALGAMAAAGPELQELIPEEWDALRLEAGAPEFGRDIKADEAFPQEARLESAVSYSKGCYLGQETMSRLHHMGHVNRVLATLRIDGPEKPEPGDAVLFEEREIGTVAGAAFSARRQAVLALAFLRPERSRAGTPVRIRRGPRTLAGSVASYHSG